MIFPMLWKHIWLCISIQHNVRELVGNPHLLFMFEVCYDCDPDLCVNEMKEHIQNHTHRHFAKITEIQ